MFVVNDEANPVPVTIQGAPAEPTPFQRFRRANLSIGDDSASLIVATIPMGKRLVIEHVSVGLSLDAGAHAICDLVVTGGGTNIHRLVVVPQGLFSSIEVFTVSQQITMFAESGQEVAVECNWRPALSTQLSMPTAISGYLVDE